MGNPCEGGSRRLTDFRFGLCAWGSQFDLVIATTILVSGE